MYAFFLFKGVDIFGWHYESNERKGREDKTANKKLATRLIGIDAAMTNQFRLLTPSPPPLPAISYQCHLIFFHHKLRVGILVLSLGCGCARSISPKKSGHYLLRLSVNERAYESSFLNRSECFMIFSPP